MLRSLLVTLCCLILYVGSASASRPPDPANATYEIGTESITLRNGRSEVPVAPGSAAKRLTVLLPELTAHGEVTGDGAVDTVAILVDQPGGTGSFYYLAVLPGPAAARWPSLGAALLGDRIKVERVSVADGVVTVDYLDRKPDEPMSAPPSVKMTRRFVAKGGVLVPTT